MVEQVTALPATVMPWDPAMSYATAEFLVVGVCVRASPHKAGNDTLVTQLAYDVGSNEGQWSKTVFSSMCNNNAFVGRQWP